MKSIKQSNKKAAFTIVEVLTVMSIIMILMGILLPAYNKINRFAKTVAVTSELVSIQDGLADFGKPIVAGGYGDDFLYSDAKDETGADYCGAMKFCEAVLGQDLLGFHPDSRFREDFTVDGTPATLLYDYDPTIPGDDPDDDNLRRRDDPALPVERAHVYRLWHIYGRGNTAPFREDIYVLCDGFSRVTNHDTTPGVKRRIGMPILFYKANKANERHFVNDNPDSPENIYNYRDNDELVKLGMPWNPALSHPICSDGGPTSKTGVNANPAVFYEKTRDYKINIQWGRPHMSDSYILMSAGFDGEYGTADDIFNFRD